MPLVFQDMPSPNHEARIGNSSPRYLILHYTGCTATETINRFLDGTPGQPGGRLSAHYLIHTDGHITRFVDENRRAWHAGISYWQGETDLNSTSIGIEIENLGEYDNYPAFPDLQIESVITLGQDILQRHPLITPFNVLGHSDIAPGRKLDPGPKFPWAKLATHGLGVMPPETDDYLMDNDHRSILTQIGYHPDLPVDVCYRAFCAHYAPEGLGEMGLAAADFKLWAFARLQTQIKITLTHSGNEF